MRIVNLSHVVNLRLTSDVPTALDRHLGATNWRYVGWEQPRLGLERSPLANPYSCKPRHNRQRVHVPTRQTGLQNEPISQIAHLCGSIPSWRHSRIAFIRARS